MDLYTFLRTNKILGPCCRLANRTYRKIKASAKQRRDFKCRYRFIDRSTGSENLCVVLAGYKEFACEAVFGRIKAFSMPNMDICVLSSGLHSQKLEQLCAQNGWSYLSTKKNHVSLIQNIAISLHPNAQYIFKLDEDIFVTEHYFENMLRAYHHAEEGDFDVGVMAPLIPINGYAHLRILDKLGLRERYTALFEKPLHKAGSERLVESHPDAARFFWGKDGYVPSIDEMNAKFSEDPLRETACPIRFSIGAILFKRELWEAFGHFAVQRLSNGMGVDEEQLCSACCLLSRPLMVSENVVVGHLSFGKQNAPMQAYFLQNPEKFIHHSAQS